MAENTNTEVIAAVDLGSNSFHMVVAQQEHGDLQIKDRLRERVALAEGLTEDRRLTPEAKERALECLERFGQRLREIPENRVRAVGTNTLRQLHENSNFVVLAEEALGHPIQIISGSEEARLVYLGVAHGASPVPGNRLVIDIGGGSTECILGKGFDVIAERSLYMGCVNHSLRYFDEGKITQKRMEKAMLAAMLTLRSIKRRFRNLGWQSCIGSSGTIRTISGILTESGVSRDVITPQGLKQLRDVLLDRGHVDFLDIPGLPDERRAVLPGGLTVLMALFESLNIESMDISSSALREGVLFDLLGRIHHEDVRDRTIKGFSKRYHVDQRQASRVAKTALHFLGQVRESWGLSDPALKPMLDWAARLHEIGLSISYHDYRKHGAYIVANADMLGFSRDDQGLMALLIRRHRGRLRVDAFDGLDDESAATARKLCVLLRLAVRLNRSRTPRPLPAINLNASGKKLKMSFPNKWLERHSLTRLDLETEARMLKQFKVTLELDDSP